MGGFSSITGDETIVFADNASFDGTQRGGKMTTDGQLWIGATASPHVKLGSLTSPSGSITIGYSSPNITLDLAGGTTAIDSIAVDTTTGGGTNPVLPTGAGLVTMTGGQYSTGAFGTRVITINSPAPNTLTVEAQISSTNATTLITKNGICHFSSTDFSVDANGFVTSNGRTISWQTISANQTLVKDTGYICISPGGALSLALPSTASSTIGDIIEVTLDGATSWTITQAAGQQIRFSSSQTTVGVGGSLASTAAGDTIEMVYQASGKWNVISAVGNLTVT